MTPEDKNSVSQKPDDANTIPKVYIPQLFSGYVSSVDEINKAMSQQFADVGNNAQKAMSSMISSISIDTNFLDLCTKGVAESISGILNSIDLQFDLWASANKQIFESIEKSNERISKATPILYKHKWFITLSLPITFVLEVSEIALSKKNVGMDLRKAFIHHFFDYNYYNMEQLIKGWKKNPLFEPRMKVFRDCLAVLRSSNDQFNAANVIIPALIAQIDGILVDHLLQRCGFTYTRKAKRGEKWRNQNGNAYENRNQAYESLFNTSGSNALDDFIIETGNDFILKKLFQKAYTKEPLEVPFSLSRHKIMHGEYLKYGKKENLVRLLLTLDFLYCLDDSGSKDKNGA